MTTVVILEQYSLRSSLGSCAETVADLFDGASALAKVTEFGDDLVAAPFLNKSFRNPVKLVSALLSDINISELEPQSTLCIFSCAKGSLQGIENPTDESALSPDLYVQAKHLVDTLGIPAGNIMVVSTACASGASALDIASDFLSADTYKNVLVFGYDYLSSFVVSGFLSLGAISKTSCKPFDSNRDGLSPGECGVMALLSQRKAFEGDIVVAGCGSSNDANHRTGPSRTGDGLSAAIFMALNASKHSVANIGAVKCHATGTPYNDAMEAKALFTVFEDTIPPCFGVKGALGHTSGAGSLLEIIIGAECLMRGLVPPTVGFTVLGVDETIPISSHAQTMQSSSILCLSAGFGGINTATILTEYSAS